MTDQSSRPAGDDVILSVRVRRANLRVLEAGFKLPVDSIVQFIPRDGDAHDFRIETTRLGVVPDPVGMRRVS